MASNCVNSVEIRNACRRCVRDMRTKQIGSQNDFRRWALHHHPDKGGDVGEFQRTSECVDLVYRDGCLDQVRAWERERRSVNDWARTEAIIASVIQSGKKRDSNQSPPSLPKPPHSDPQSNRRTGEPARDSRLFQKQEHGRRGTPPHRARAPLAAFFLCVHWN